MPEKCPLLNSPLGVPFIDERIPDFCRKHCEDRWDNAVKVYDLAGEYDTYSNLFTEECKHEGGIIYSHDAIVALGKQSREYVIVDMCEDCHAEYGEQSYKFECPNS